MSYPIESFPESKKEFELIENCSSNRGNKLKRGVEYIHRKDMAWTPEGFKPVGSEQNNNKTEVKSEFKSNALKSVKSKEAKSNTQSLLNNSQNTSKSLEYANAIDQLTSLNSKNASKNLDLYKKYSINFLTQKPLQVENLSKNILSFVQQEFEFRKGLQKFCDFINNKEWEDFSKTGDEERESNEFKGVKRRAIELAEEVNYNTSEFERYLKLSRTKLLKTLQTREDYSNIVINGGDAEQIKLMEINSGSSKKLSSEAVVGKYSKSGKNGGGSGKSKTKSSHGVISGSNKVHGNSKVGGSGNKPKNK